MACKEHIQEVEEQNKKLFKKSLSKKYEDAVDRFFAAAEKKLDRYLFEKTPLRHVTVPKEVREVAEMVGAYRMDTVEMARNAVKISDFLSEHLSEEDSVALTRALGGDAEVPEHLRSVYDRFRKIIDANADALVKAGALDEKYKIKDYLKRYYKQYLEERHGFSVAMSKVFKRKDLTHEERLELGLVENADFVVANTILEQKKQLKKARLLKQIADTFAIDEPKDGYVRVSDETVGGGIYKYGALAGKYLPQRVYTELVQAKMVGDSLAFLDKSLWTDIIDHIKVNVTVKNPGTHLYNILSNVSLAYLNGDIVPLLQVLKMAVTDREKFKKLVRLSRKFGLNSDLNDYERLHTGLEKTKGDTNILKSFFKNLYMAEGTKVGDAVRAVYSAEDEIFKLASFYKRIKGRKLSTATARKEFKEAMADYVDYSTPLPPVIRRLDKNGIFPFSHYVWKSTPRVAKIIAKNPIKFTLLQIALLESGASVFSEDDNVQKPEWAGDKGLFGIHKYIPSNLYAAKQWVQLEGDKFVNLGRALPGMRLTGLSFEGGFVGSFLDILRGRDPLWKSKYYKESDTNLQAVVKGLQKFTENFAPSITFGRYAQRAVKKITGFKPPKNAYKEELSWEEFWGRMAGLRKFDRGKEAYGHFKSVWRAYRNGNATKEEAEREIKKIMGFVKKHKLDFPYKKAKSYQKRYEKRKKDFSFWEKWFY
jgi:hypothetical protein